MGATADPPLEAEIQRVEQLEAGATLRNDVDALKELWSDRLIVNSTANLIVTREQLLGMMRAGYLKLTMFERRTSRTVVENDIAVVTGNEQSTLASGEAAGDLLLCSYMNVWNREGANWKLIARHLGLIARTPPDPKQ